jgi:hypothetical protein
MTKASSSLSPSDPRSLIARRGKLTSSVRIRAMANLTAAELSEIKMRCDKTQNSSERDEERTDRN